VHDVIGYLEGTSGPYGLVVTSAGVGYKVHTPAPLPEGQQVALWVHTAVSESAITLWGMDSPEAYELFTALLRCAGVGPKTASDILSSGPLDQVTAVLASADPKQVSALKGVGKTTATRLCTELKMPAVLTPGSSPGAVAGAGKTTVLLTSTGDDLLDTLLEWGHAQTSAHTALTQARTIHDDDGQVLAAALKTLRNGQETP